MLLSSKVIQRLEKFSRLDSKGRLYFVINGKAYTAKQTADRFIFNTKSHGGNSRNVRYERLPNGEYWKAEINPIDDCVYFNFSWDNVFALTERELLNCKRFMAIVQTCNVGMSRFAFMTRKKIVLLFREFGVKYVLTKLRYIIQLDLSLFIRNPFRYLWAALVNDRETGWENSIAVKDERRDNDGIRRTDGSYSKFEIPLISPVLRKMSKLISNNTSSVEARDEKWYYWLLGLCLTDQLHEEIHTEGYFCEHEKNMYPFRNLWDDFYKEWEEGWKLKDRETINAYSPGILALTTEGY